MIWCDDKFVHSPTGVASVPEEKSRIRVKIGDSEFEAEGDRDIVSAQYNMFLDTIRHVSKSILSVSAPHGQPYTSEPSYDVGIMDGTEGSEDQAASGTELNARVFSRHKDLVSLRVLPETKKKNADALILILYGYQVLKGEDAVLGTQLMKSARQSGLSIDRIDRVISENRGLFIRGGARRGVRYALNNQGERHAIKVMNEMFE